MTFEILYESVRSILRMSFILVALVAFQFNSKPLSASPIVFAQDHHTGGISVGGSMTQLESGFSSANITHTEVAVGVGEVASVTTDIPYDEAGSCPLGIHGIGSSVSGRFGVWWSILLMDRIEGLAKK